MASSSIRTGIRTATRYSTGIQRSAATLSPRHASSSTQANDDWTLPEIHLGPTHSSRYHEHYDNTLSTDLLYMTYNHRLASTSSTSTSPPSTTTTTPPSTQTPYELNRPTPAPRGNRPIAPSSKPLTPTTIPQLTSITIHTMVKEAIGSKQNLLTAIMALRAISGETSGGAGRKGSSGVQVLSSKKGAAAWKLRAGMPVAVKVELKGEAMYDFLESLVDFVLPRLREFPGIPLPPNAASKTSPSAVAGVVSFGLPSLAMGLFPQVEANLDAYPKLHGFHMHFQTNIKGRDAQEHARTLLSGFRIPFHRR